MRRGKEGRKREREIRVHPSLVMRMGTSPRTRRLLFARSITVTYRRGTAVSKGWVVRASKGAVRATEGGQGWSGERSRGGGKLQSCDAYRKERGGTRRGHSPLRPEKAPALFLSAALLFFSSWNTLCGCAALRALLMMHEYFYRFFDFGP